MPAKSIKLEGYGTVYINSIGIKERELESVDPTGKPVTQKIIGSRAKTVYVTEDGIEIPSGQVCKKMEVDGEELIIPKFPITKEVSKDDISLLEDNGIVYRAIDRKFYNAVTDNQQLKDLIINQNKSLSFAASFGSGFKLWNAVLTNWNNKLLLVGCRGDLAKELEKYDEQTVEFEIEIMPKKIDKRLLKAIAQI